MNDLHLPPARPPLRGRLAPLAPWLPVLTLAIGIGLGGFVMAAASDPAGSDEYQALQGELAERDRSVDRLIERATRAEGALNEQAAAAAQLEQREAAVAAREQAVTVVEQQVAANSITEGTWTVGVDIEPGTYRTREPVGSDCYWGIYAGGSNGSDIIDNGIPGGGFPVVELREGQVFENARCGTFVKQ